MLTSEIALLGYAPGHQDKAEAETDKNPPPHDGAQGNAHAETREEHGGVKRDEVKEEVKAEEAGEQRWTEDQKVTNYTKPVLK